MSIDIRPVRPEEYDEAGRITADAYREYARGDDWTEYLERIADVRGRAGRTLVLGAFEEGEVLGSVTLELDERVETDGDHHEARRLPPSECHIRMLGVRPDARGRGIGRSLMDACMALARGEGKTLMTLNTGERMKTAQRMYESMGFERLPDERISEDFSLLSYAISLA